MFIRQITIAEFKMKLVIFLLILGLSSYHVLGFIPLGNLGNSLNSDYYDDYGTETIKENTLKEGNLLHEFQNAVMKTKIKFLNLLDAVSQVKLNIVYT